MTRAVPPLPGWTDTTEEEDWCDWSDRFLRWLTLAVWAVVGLLCWALAFWALGIGWAR